MKDKVTTNQIEEVLLKRESEEFTERFNKAKSALLTVLSDYGVDFKGLTKEDREEFRIWLVKSFDFERSGSNLVTCYPIHRTRLPACVNRRLLNRAIPKFMEETAHAHSVMEDVYRQEEEGNHES